MCEWNEDRNRAAGVRQTLTIYGRDYGFCWIPAGKFNMGSRYPADALNASFSETFHNVTLTRGFWALETPVTQELYRRVLPQPPAPSDNTREGDDYPVWGIGYGKALLFCRELTEYFQTEEGFPAGLKADLPTEAQWEYACRAGTNTEYNFGNEFQEGYAWLPKDEKNLGPYRERAPQVKRWAPNAWGLYDMHGLVWERCKDLLTDYPQEPVVDPQGLEVQDWRAAVARKIFSLRGGSWLRGPKLGRSAFRGQSYCDDTENDIGFRIILYCD